MFYFFAAKSDSVLGLNNLLTHEEPTKVHVNTVCYIANKIFRSHKIISKGKLKTFNYPNTGITANIGSLQYGQGLPATYCGRWEQS